MPQKIKTTCEWKPDSHYVEDLSSQLFQCTALGRRIVAKIVVLNESLLRAKKTTTVSGRPATKPSDSQEENSEVRDPIHERRSLIASGLPRCEVKARHIVLGKNFQKISH